MQLDAGKEKNDSLTHFQVCDQLTGRQLNPA